VEWIEVLAQRSDVDVNVVDKLGRCAHTYWALTLQWSHSLGDFSHCQQRRARGQNCAALAVRPGLRL
jgi:hypothetical protein